MNGMAWKRLDAIERAEAYGAAWDGLSVTLSHPRVPGAPWWLCVAGLVRVELVGALDLVAAQREAEVWLRQRQRSSSRWRRMMDKAVPVKEGA